VGTEQESRTPVTITIAYTERYLGWRGSAASPQRARLAVEHILARAEDQNLPIAMLEPVLDQELAKDCLALVHDASYVKRVFKGKDGHADSREQGQIATLMFLGTEILVRQIEQDGLAPRVYFNPQGAKHHAQFNRSSGFCVFNDHAWAAQYFAAQGKRVAYLDWDVHHGDGVENLTRENPLIMTASIQGRGFPGTGHRSSMKHRALNYMLEDRAGDDDLLEAVEDALYAFRDFEPDIILLACGADGLKNDPLGPLSYTIEGITAAAHLVGQLAFELGVPVLVGGAGGYQPFTYTPIAWAETILAIHQELEGGPKVRMHAPVALHRDSDAPAFEPSAWDDPDFDAAYADPEWAVEDDRADDTRARKQAILDDLAAFPVLQWESLLRREEWDLVEAEIRPKILAAMEEQAGAKPTRTREDRNQTRRQAKGKVRA
jgi:acetoin utilization protein AcuC